MPPLELWATDVNPAYLERANEGVYTAKALARVPAEARARFFRPAGRASFRVVDALPEGIRWQVHDLTADPPPARDFHLVFLRNNLLTYYRGVIVEATLPAIVDSLAPGGILVIGQKEHLPDFHEGLRPPPGSVLSVPEAGIERTDVTGRSNRIASCNVVFLILPLNARFQVLILI